MVVVVDSFLIPVLQELVLWYWNRRFVEGLACWMSSCVCTRYGDVRESLGTRGLLEGLYTFTFCTFCALLGGEVALHVSGVVG